MNAEGGGDAPREGQCGIALVILQKADHGARDIGAVGEFLLRPAALFAPAADDAGKGPGKRIGILHQCCRPNPEIPAPIFHDAQFVQPDGTNAVPTV